MQEHPKFFQETPLICVNTFSLTDTFLDLKPEYYVILDPFFWKQESDLVKKTLQRLEEKVDWKMQLMIPRKAAEHAAFQQLVRNNPNIQLVAYNYTVYKGLAGIGHWLYKHNIAMPQSLNVSIVAVLLGLNIGYEEVFLVGADHTWHENLHMSQDNVLHTKVTHFYENDAEVKYIPYHKGSDPTQPTNTAYEFFDIWSRTFLGYMQVRAYADHLGKKVYNASESSFIDAFERKKLS